MSAQVLPFLYGAITCASLLIGIKFLRFWSASRDRFFLWFVAAFWVFAVAWVIRAFGTSSEDAYYVYLPRLVAFLLIIAAILEKNRKSSS